MSAAFRASQNANLKNLNTFGVDVVAPHLVEVDDLSRLDEALEKNELDNAFLLGSGSNVVFASAPARVLRFMDARITASDAAAGSVEVRCAAGMPWHAFVMHTLERGWFGLENLALIPGTVGASPVQNIGAYGVEVMDRIDYVEAWDRRTGMPVKFMHDACSFSYRDSRFKHEPDRYLITHVGFRLGKTPALVLDYAGIRDALAGQGIASPTPMDVARAVMRERLRKLPDPAVIGNAGSFFKNPLVSETFAAELASEHPGLPLNRSQVKGTRKLSAAWLIEQTGMKGYRDGPAGVSDQHALVLVNHGGARGDDILRVARSVADAVETRFGVPLHPEPRLVGASW